MALKKPLCLYSGDIKELQAGDTIPAGTSSAGLFDIDLSGDLMPTVAANTDEYYELDVNDDIMPKA